MLRNTWLRCTLREARARAAARGPWRAHSTQPHGPSSIKWKHFHPHGHIVGSGRMRQRVISADLVRKSLDQPASVIVLRDAQQHRPSVQAHAPANANANANAALRASEDEQRQQQQHRQALIARDIERAISGHEPAPEAAEVNASIQMLQPSAAMLEQARFEQLRRLLTQRYSLQQLSHYLATHLRPSAALTLPPGEPKHRARPLQASPWQPGQTPLFTRRATIVRPTALSRKFRTAERILRLVWKLTIHSEERAIGELELALQPWQLSMLFDLSVDGKQYYESLISPQILMDTTSVQHYRPDNVVRITGRRRDAEEVSYQLELALQAVRQLDLDLASFAPPARGVGPAAPTSDFYTDEELAHVSKLTQSVITSRGRNMVTIHSSSDAGANNARRMLLSILSLPLESATLDDFAPTALTSIQSSGDSHAPCLVPADATTLGLNIRESGLHLARQVLGKAATSANLLSSPEQRHDAAREIVDHLLTIGFRRDFKHYQQLQTSSYWNTDAVVPTQWRTEIVRLLHERAWPTLSSAQAQEHLQQVAKVTSQRSVVQRHLPAVESILSHFDAQRSSQTQPAGNAYEMLMAVDQRAPQLTAYLVPAPLNAKQYHLPRIELLFGFTEMQQRDLRLAGMRAVLEAQMVRVPLQSYAADLLFAREQTVEARIESVRQDVDISAFAESLQRSVRGTEGVISAPPELVVRLPMWLIQNSTKQDAVTHDLPVTYWLERFELTHKRIFAASKAGLLGEQSNLHGCSGLEKGNGSWHLEYREVDGGAIHGSRSTLAVEATGQRSRDPADNDGRGAASHTATSSCGNFTAEGAGIAGSNASARSIYQVASAALAVAELMTRAADGSIKEAKFVET